MVGGMDEQMNMKQRRTDNKFNPQMINDKLDDLIRIGACPCVLTHA